MMRKSTSRYIVFMIEREEEKSKQQHHQADVAFVRIRPVVEQK